jgi:Tol biopolymer transport system component
MPPAMNAQYGEAFGRNKVRYDDFDWEIYHSTHFNVYYYASEEHLLQKVVSYAESAYDQLSQKLDFQIQDPINLIFYDTHSAFEQTNVILNFIPEGTGAFATPVRNRMVLPVDLPGPELMALILHELTHIFQYQMLFGGNLGKGVAATPPLWFMEGMASYFAKDETARDKMYLRDAVVNDRLPSIQQNFGGFFAYRFGHAVFDFIEERWGEEGVRDFMIETRNTLGGRVGRSVGKAFGIDAEEFDSEFRRWLRKQYLPELIETGEPADFGRPFRIGSGPGAPFRTSPAASPSGDLLAAFSTKQGQIDVMLFDAQRRIELKNLTSGYNRDFEYFVAQELTLGRVAGRDVAFSPDGNQVAFFGRREGGRALILANVLKGKIATAIDMDVEQQLAPAFSADGSQVAFAANKDGQFDIFVIDLETREVSKITNDDIYDTAPVYSPDGESLVMTSVVGGFAKLFRIDLDNPTERYPVTTGESNETDAVYNGDGSRIYFTSDRTGANNIFSVDVESGGVIQHTNTLTGAFQPTVLANPTGGERLVFTGFWKGRLDLYLLDVDDPVTEPVILENPEDMTVSSIKVDELARYEPSIEVSIDEDNIGRYSGRKFFLEDVGGALGVSTDNTFVGVVVLTFSDFLGDRRIIGQFQTISSFQNFDVYYANLSRRMQWNAHVYDNRDFFVGRDLSTGELRRGDAAATFTGLEGGITYPFTPSHRFEATLGVMRRELDFQSFLFDPDGNLILDPETGFPVPIISPREDDFPYLRASFVGDKAIAASHGFVTGRRWRFSADYAPDLDSGSDNEDQETGEGSTLTAGVEADIRQYIPVTKRSNFALRFWGRTSDGNFPTPVYFGGLGTVRGFDFRSLVGDNGFYTNLEFRFPFIDFLATPIFGIQQMRGVVFLDVAGAWYDEVQSFRFYNSDEGRLEDAVSSYGIGLSFRLFGMPWNVDFSKRWNFDETLTGWESTIWFGPRF